MARKNYPDEFKRDAVALYRDTEGATITPISVADMETANLAISSVAILFSAELETKIAER